MAASEFFDRAPVEFRPALDEAHRRLPAVVTRAISPRYLCGVSPHFVGLHHSVVSDLDGYEEWIGEEHSYENCAHVCYLRDHGRQTIVLPLFRREDPWFYDYVLHEIGHCFDEATGFSIQVPETTDYSRANREEAFAEAFMAILTETLPRWNALVAGEPFRPLRVAMGLDIS